MRPRSRDDIYPSLLVGLHLKPHHPPPPATIPTHLLCHQIMCISSILCTGGGQSRRGNRDGGDDISLASQDGGSRLVENPQCVLFLLSLHCIHRAVFGCSVTVFFLTLQRYLFVSPQHQHVCTSVIPSA